MSGIKRHNRRQSDVPSKELPSQRHRHATSSMIRLAPNEAMEMIDWLVQGEETNSGVDAMMLSSRPTPESIEGILFIDGSLFARGAAGPQGQLPVNVSREELKEYLDFPGSKDSSRVESASVIEAELLRHTCHKSLKNAWTTIPHWFDYQNAQPRNGGWLID
ncbi:hypothetical protein R1flu_018251 [Riccia fluitans]|uniref:Uncharacterized protein n=1 Tax=Riccia fluitans TaxID=41844 RepID=A0ABD1ZFB6_9MARC